MPPHQEEREPPRGQSAATESTTSRTEDSRYAAQRSEEHNASWAAGPGDLSTFVDLPPEAWVEPTPATHHSRV